VFIQGDVILAKSLGLVYRHAIHIKGKQEQIQNGALKDTRSNWAYVRRLTLYHFKTLMPHRVKAFAKIWKHSNNYIAVVKGLHEAIH